MFCYVDVFCYMSISYDLMNALFFVFLQKSTIRLQTSINLLTLWYSCKIQIPCLFSLKKHPMVNDIFYLTWCDDLWALPSVSHWCLVVNMYGQIRALPLNWPGQLSIAARGHGLAGDILFPTNRQSPTLSSSVQSQ